MWNEDIRNVLTGPEDKPEVTMLDLFTVKIFPGRMMFPTWTCFHKAALGH